MQYPRIVICAVLAFVAVGAIDGQARAASVLSLPNGEQVFSTGISDSGSNLSTGSVDGHWSLSENPTGGTSAYVHKHSAWSSDSGEASRWLTPVDESTDAGLRDNTEPGAYAVQTQVDLSGLLLSSVVIEGLWASDNGGLDVLINGTSIGPAALPGTTSFQFDPSTAFTLDNSDGLLLVGVNTFTFRWNNDANPSNPGGRNPAGVRIEFTSAEAVAAPLPAAGWAGLALLGALGLARRRLAG